MTVRVLIADDQGLLRSSLETVLGADERIDVVAAVGDGGAAIEACRAQRVDVALMDVRMPRVDGIEATRELVALAADRRLHTRVLVLTTFDLDEYVFAAIEAGASGFLTKDARPAELVDAICRVYEGDAVVAPRATTALLEHVRRTRAVSGSGPTGRCAGSALAPLSPRERDVIALLATGASNDEIGERLYLTTNTVKTHVKSILGKLGLPDRIHVVIWAYEHGVVQPGEGAAPR